MRSPARKGTARRVNPVARRVLQVESLECRSLLAVGLGWEGWQAPRVAPVVRSANSLVGNESSQAVHLASAAGDTSIGRPATAAGVRLAASATQGWQVLDEVGFFDTSDSYSLKLASASHVRIDVVDQWLPVVFDVTDAQGRTLQSGLVSDAPQSAFEADLPAGNYKLSVSAAYRTPTFYRMLVETTPFAPAPTPAPTPPVTKPIPPAAPPKAPTSPTAPAPRPAPPAAPPVAFPDVVDFGGERDWNLNSIRAPEAWAKGFAGKGVVVAVVDTGVDRTHVDLQNNIWRNTAEVPGDGRDNDGNGFVDDIFGWNFANNNANTMDGNGHGTHVAGTIAAVRNEIGATGVAYQAKIMPVRVLDADGAGTDYAVARGIRYAVDNHADIINLSLGSDGYSSTLLSAIDYASRNDVLIVAAAGNESARTPSYPGRFSDRYTNVISVGAYDRTDRIANFSNAPGIKGIVQVAAPGVNIFSTLPGNRYASWNGTSMASPHVAGLAALMLSANRQLKPADLRAMLFNGANRSIAGSATKGVNAASSVAMTAPAVTPKSLKINNASPPRVPTATNVVASQAAVIFRATVWEAGENDTVWTDQQRQDFSLWASAVERLFAQDSNDDELSPRAALG